MGRFSPHFHSNKFELGELWSSLMRYEALRNQVYTNIRRRQGGAFGDRESVL